MCGLLVASDLEKAAWVVWSRLLSIWAGLVLRSTEDASEAARSGEQQAWSGMVLCARARQICWSLAQEGRGRPSSAPGAPRSDSQRPAGTGVGGALGTSLEVSSAFHKSVGPRCPQTQHSAGP